MVERIVIHFRNAEKQPRVAEIPAQGLQAVFLTRQEGEAFAAQLGVKTANGPVAGAAVKDANGNTVSDDPDICCLLPSGMRCW